MKAAHGLSSVRKPKARVRSKASPRFFVSILAAWIGLTGASSCALFYTRPVQEMSYTSAAIRAAKEVQADTLSPELYREANEWWLKSKKEYKFKNFKLALDYARQSRRLAEQAEFEALRNGGTRNAVDTPPDPFFTPEAPAPEPVPYQYPTPTGTPVEVYDQRKAEEDREKARVGGQTSTPGGLPGGTTPVPMPNIPTQPSGGR